MKFNEKQNRSGEWIVTAGRGKVFTKEFPSKSDAHQFAILQSALFHMAEAQELSATLTSFEDTMQIGHIANNIIDSITDTGIESGEINSSDSRGWLA